MATVKALHIAIGANTSGFSRGMKKARRELRTFMRSAAPIGRAVKSGFLAAGAGVAAVVGGVALAVRSFAQFESAMLRVKAVTGATGSDFKAMSDQAKQLGATTAFTAQEAAQGMGFLGQAGFSANEIMEAMPSVLDLAAAGQLELADAADITASVLRGFGKSAAEAGNVADILAKAASSSNTSVQEMGEGFKFVGPVASAMGVSIEETAALLGVLADAGLKGSLGGTGLRQALVKLGPEIIKSGGDVTATLKKLDSEGIRAVTGAMKDLGARAGTAAIALANNTERAEELTEAMRNADGTTKDMADTLMSGVTGSALELKSAFDAVVQGIGEAFGPASIGFMDSLAEALGVLLDQVKKLGERFGSTELSGSKAFEMLLDGLEELAVGAMFVGDTFRAVFLGLRVAIGGLLTAIVAFLREFSNVAGMVVGLFSDEAAKDIEDGVVMLTHLRDELASGVISDADAIGGLFNETGVRKTFDDMRDALKTTQEVAEEVTEEIKTGLEEVAETVQEKVVPTLGEMFPDLAKVRGNFQATAEEIRKTLSAAGVGEGVISASIEEGIKLSDLREIESRLAEIDLAEALLGSGGLAGAIDPERLRKTILESLPEAAKADEPETPKTTNEAIATVLGSVKVDTQSGKRDSDNLEKIAKNTAKTAASNEVPFS